MAVERVVMAFLKVVDRLPVPHKTILLGLALLLSISGAWLLAYRLIVSA
jgi:hypothetical protein